MKPYKLPESINPCMTMQKAFTAVNKHLAACFLQTETEKQFERDRKKLLNYIIKMIKSDNWKREVELMNNIKKESMNKWYKENF